MIFCILQLNVFKLEKTESCVENVDVLLNQFKYLNMWSLCEAAAAKDEGGEVDVLKGLEVADQTGLLEQVGVLLRSKVEV